jgi:TonB family protein
MRVQRTRRPSLRSGRSRCSLGSPLTRYPLGARNIILVSVGVGAAVLACRRTDTPKVSSEQPTSRPIQPSPNRPLPSPTAEVFRVGGDVSAPVLVDRVQPKYPKRSGVEHELGVLMVQVVIGRDGFIRELQVLKGPSNAYSRAAIEAIRRWRYKPAMRRGEPVDVELVITVLHIPAEPDA